MLTPLWTGGVDGTMDRIHETGILGSLRWWYEAIVRGLGGEACDPTEHTCELSGARLRRYEEARRNGRDWWTALDEAGICDACKVFGTTGWQRRFRVEIVEDNTRPIWEPKDRMLNIRPPGRTRGWYLPPGHMGSLTLKFTGDPKILSLMAVLMRFIEKWGALGAKTQLGYGVFKIDNWEEILARTRSEPGWQWHILGNKKANSKRPDLRQFGFFKFRFPRDREGWWQRISALARVAGDVQPMEQAFKIVPVAPVLKNEWRFHQWKGPRYLESRIFGSLRPARQRSRVSVSWAYLEDSFWEIRGWVWLASYRWANDLWSILTKEDTWQRVLVQGYPKTQFESKRLSRSKDVLEMIKEVIR